MIILKLFMVFSKISMFAVGGAYTGIESYFGKSSVLCYNVIDVSVNCVPCDISNQAIVEAVNWNNLSRGW